MTWFYDHAASLVRFIYEKRISAPAILDSGRNFPNAKKFAAAWQEIRDEALKVRLNRSPRFHDIMPEQAEISANDGIDWRMFVLKAYDVPVPENAALMPRLSAILAGCPEVKSCSISYLAPHKHIPAHRGPFRGIMRFHLGLSVPSMADGRPAAVMTIDGSQYRIADGETLLWDDTFTHEVLNDSEEPRIVLLLDVWRPRMPADLKLLSQLILKAVQLAMKYRQVSYTG